MRDLSVESDSGFHVLARSSRSETATMVLAPGETTGGPDNRHEGSDQWLLVLAGRGLAMVGGERVALAPNSLLLIEAGETHEIAAGADGPLKTINFYAPPAY